MVQAENVCRFTGIISKSDIKTGPTSLGTDYVMCKVDLKLPDPDSEGAQYIKLIAWDDTAERLSEVPLGTWIEVICCYTPELWNNRLYDNFQVGAFKVL